MILLMPSWPLMLLVLLLSVATDACAVPVTDVPVWYFIVCCLCHSASARVRHGMVPRWHWSEGGVVYSNVWRQDAEVRGFLSSKKKNRAGQQLGTQQKKRLAMVKHELRALYSRALWALQGIFSNTATPTRRQWIWRVLFKAGKESTSRFVYSFFTTAQVLQSYLELYKTKYKTMCILY